MMHVIGEYRKYQDFLLQVIEGLGPNSHLRLGKETHALEDIEIETKYYRAKTSIAFRSVCDCTDPKERARPGSGESPDAILVLLDESYLEKPPPASGLLDSLEERYANRDITRLLCIFQSPDPNLTFSSGNGHKDGICEKRSEIESKCNSLNYELIPVSTALSTRGYGELSSDSLDNHRSFTYCNGIQRVIQALHCTKWKAMIRKSTACLGDKHQFNGLHDSESTLEEDLLLDDFQILSDLIRQLKSDGKTLTDHERRERASKLILDITRHLDKDLDE
ncbi:hypothetical protein HWI79_2056 [Cryptosporidium felis]|nr:hypothetical protein HWI79_2056 [Cryptosporidium felis]